MVSGLESCGGGLTIDKHPGHLYLALLRAPPGAIPPLQALPASPPALLRAPLRRAAPLSAGLSLCPPRCASVRRAAPSAAPPSVRRAAPVAAATRPLTTTHGIMMASTEHKTALGTTVKLSGQNYILCMEESVSANVMFLNTAKAMWDALHDMYSHEKNISRVFELYERLFSLKQDGRAVSDYFALLKGTSDEILLYHPLSCDAQTRKAQWEDFLVAKFLSGLDNSLKVVRDHLLASDSVPTLSNALARVLRVATGSTDSVSSSGTTTESSAMAVRGRARPSSRGRGGRGRASTNPTHSRYCTHCGRTNHVVDKCWIKHGKPDWANTVTSGGDPAALEPTPHPSESVTLSREEYEQLLHRPVANSATPPTSSSPDVFAALHGKSWMLDSGATTHLTVSLLRNTIAQSPFSPLTVCFRICKHGGRLVAVMSVVAYTSSIHPHLLKLMLFLPRFPLFNGIVALAIRPFLHYRKLPIKSPRLACESCELGKHHRASFPPRVDKRSSSPFTLVHSDIWGPCRFESINGFRYFITFVDDYSRMTWVYLLKDRSQVPTIITSFYNEIKTQFSVNIRILRTDNALEFVQKTVSDFCDSNGILHQTSCPYTSQQNGVAERKHRHLLDVARTIMTHMHVPKSYWGDAILTASYLINRLPSSILNGDTPYSCLFPDSPLFGVTPRVFGCVCFVHLHSPNLDKLSPRSVKCIFLGYSRAQKGYRCYDPQRRRSFTSADVTFFESTPYYSPNSSPTIPLTSVPLPIPTLPIPPHTEPPTRPLQVYSRRKRSTNTTLTAPPGLPPTAAPGPPFRHTNR
ncbi:Retrovirus-related Pol polyprotein from transposon TNT 1-94 [Sesamum angolense]|uniref:Retrovirus-related Pol polyprotein from transposon TNT 1-94 n=1 Tax=Sesamum angolense TaxID=2727404 RepID=A0AAE1WAY1_9LAMI|nr:Retrovirus-related Pol polyprotein from transposon TNT 1-94 [Sesamum angolense]